MSEDDPIKDDEDFFKMLAQAVGLEPVDVFEFGEDFSDEVLSLVTHLSSSAIH